MTATIVPHQQRADKRSLTLIHGGGQNPFAPCLSSQPAIVIDRATRIRTFADTGELYTDNSGFKVEGQLPFHRRAGDVWRVITAGFSQEWKQGQKRPGCVELGMAEVGRALGYSRPSNQYEEIASIIDALSRLKVVVPKGAAINSVDSTRGRRKSRTEQSIGYLVIHTDELEHRDGWQITPPRWAELFPRAFARMPHNLLARPTRYEPDLWIKWIGVELAYYYQEDFRSRKEKVLRVESLLRRACLLDTVTDMVGQRHGKRAVERVTLALNTLRDEIGLLTTWESKDDVDYRRYYWFERWLDARIVITPPAHYLIANVEGDSGKAIA